MDVAARWGMSVAWMSRLVNDVSRPARYNDAFAGLPDRATVTVHRSARHVRRHKGGSQHGRTTAELRAELAAAAALFAPPRLLVAIDSTYVEEGTTLVVSGTSQACLDGFGSIGVARVQPMIHLYEPTGQIHFSLPQEDVVLRFADTGIDDEAVLPVDGHTTGRPSRAIP